MSKIIFGEQNGSFFVRKIELKKPRKNCIKLITDKEYIKWESSQYMYKVLKVADTIEELCDEFVVVRDNGQTMTALLDLAKHYAKCGIKTFGAIWTDKGLIYVAKMNDKGELELL